MNYKTKKTKKNAYAAPTVGASKWRISLAFSCLLFVLFWQFTRSVSELRPEIQEAWEEHQITLDIPLPETIETDPLQPESMERPSPQWQTFTIKPGTNLAYYFQQAKLAPASLQEVMALQDAHQLKRIYPGQILRIHSHPTGKLLSLQFDVDPLTTWVVERKEDGILRSYLEEKPIEKRIAFGGSKIVDSFFLAGKQAHLDDAMIMELANVFAYDIDFAQDIQPNDHFKVLFEEYFVNGLKVGNGPIVAAEFVNNGKKFHAIRYTDKSTGQTSYYNPAGQSLKKAFIRTPVQFTRISSHFNLKRRHPILHKIRAHRGVDYAAPTGTPVKAAGQGKVTFVGKKGGYGNTVVLQHGTKYTTLYGHLSRFANQLKQGQSVLQGQVIGYVGSTGLASGPHLHFEFQVNGVHQNPLTVPLPEADGISLKSKSHFLVYAKELLHLMNNQEKMMIAAHD